METIKMQDKVQSHVTGFEGTVTGICTYMNGCKQLLVTPRVGEDGEYRSRQWLDEQELELIQSIPERFDVRPDLDAKGEIDASLCGSEEVAAVGGPRHDAPKV